MSYKKIKLLLIGTNNQGKLREIRNLLPKEIKTYSTSTLILKVQKKPVKLFKRIYNQIKIFSKKTKLLCLSDDSGLEIDILVKDQNSARWGGKHSNFEKAIKKVYKELNKIDKNWKNKKKIKARFICALTIYWPDGKTRKSLGKVEGYISSKKKGKNGFGYDPIFIPLNKKKTYGEISPKLKYKSDHRYKAFKKIKKFF